MPFLRRPGSPLQISLAPRRLFGRVGLLIVGIALAQFAATVLLYNWISKHSVAEDHARRVAELLEVSERLHDRAEPGLAEVMSTRHLRVWLTPAPAVPTPSTADDIVHITDLVRQWEPSLADIVLHMDVQSAPGHDHLVGSMRLRDGSWLNFQSADLSQPWPIIASATLVTLLFTGLCVLLAGLALRQLGAPLRRLADATAQIGSGTTVALEETGSPDLRNVSHAFNLMQERISRILTDQTKAFVAISHDLRTPLARLKLTADFVEPPDMREMVGDNVVEMEAMIASLQAFLRAQEIADEVQEVVLANVVGQAGSRWAEHMTVNDWTSGATLTTYPTILRMALEPLIENAVQYGEHALIDISRGDAGLTVTITDQGHGFAEEHLPALIEPFFRADEARARNTPGFGLGIPTAHRLLQRFGGDLSFARSCGGGLEVTVRPPVA